MLAIELPPDIERRLAAAARRAGLVPAELVRDAIADLLEDLDDAELAAKRARHPARRWTQADLEQGLDLEYRAGRPCSARTCRAARRPVGTTTRSCLSIPMRPEFPSLSTLLHPARLLTILDAWSAVLAGHLIATGAIAAGAITAGAAPRWWVLPAQLSAAAAIYWAGMLFKDAFGASTARAASGPGTTPTAARLAWFQGGALLALGLGLAALIGWDALRGAAVLGLTLLAAAGSLRATVLGPLVSGAARYATWLLGLAAVPLGAGLQLLALPVFLYAAALAVLSAAAAPGAERRGALGRAASLLAATLMIAIVLTVGGRLAQPLALAGIALGVGALLYRLRGLRGLRRGGDPASLATLVRLMRLGLIPLDALLVFGTGHWGPAAALLLLLPAAWGLARRPAAD